MIPLCTGGRRYEMPNLQRWVENLALNDAMKRLNHRENRIIKMRFYEGKTQMEVADELAISQAQISRIEKSALQNMRTYLRA